MSITLKNTYMKNITLSVFSVLCFTCVFGQARKELNFGLIGVNYEIPVHRDITIAPGVGPVWILTG